MSRLQAGALSMQTMPTSLEEIVAHALADLGPQARGIKLVVSFGLPLALADPALLERVVVNLLTNAIRYSPAGAPPTVTASALGDRVELRVIDRGPGIPEADRDRMFAPFVRLDGHAESRRRGSRACAIARAHRGHAGHAHAGGHTRRRPDHDDLAARG